MPIGHMPAEKPAISKVIVAFNQFDAIAFGEAQFVRTARIKVVARSFLMCAIVPVELVMAEKDNGRSNSPTSGESNVLRRKMQQSSRI
ncbi:hypothetical protein M8818_007496 [Zalaria obscura]|uniref:Uncharacterized protein n=1 Tax=Zalaria obscura TaxID=2024903 RepID=A0ACC3S3Y3_9PEZI